MKKTILKIIRHRDFVRKNIHALVSELEQRAIVHDVSKFEEDEFNGFVEADEMALYKEYGSSDYHKKLKENKGIKLHLSRNSHHPEYYEYEPAMDMFVGQDNEAVKGAAGINRMSFLDIVEMVIDWKSASETYGNDFKASIDYSLKRFYADERTSWLIHLIAKDL